MNELITADPPRMPSLPQGLAALLGFVGTVQHPGQRTRYHLQGGRTLTDQERATIRETATALEQATDPLSTLGLGNIAPTEARVALLTQMMAAYSVGATTDFREDSRLTFYEMALEGVPVWAIREGIRQWVQRMCPKVIERDPNYSWAPNPSTLRGLAMIHVDALKKRRDDCMRLLSCVSENDAMDPRQRPLAPGGIVPALRRM